MTFPVYIFGIHPHFIMESLSYFIGFRIYLWKRRKENIPTDTAMWVVVGAVLGAALGSKVLYWLESPDQTIANWNSLAYLLQGKTIVGGLLGGLIGVELAKKWAGWQSSTGDDFVLPLAIGMMIGRIGCFLTGLDDHTYGTPTAWITGIDFGDGVKRHPTSLYEIAFLLCIAFFILYLKKKDKPWDGFYFQVFMLGYLTFRLFIDFIKPTPDLFLNMNNIQLASIAGILYYIQLVARKAKAIERSTLHA
ncbi:prolipoprotein diacylglyceryl transferase [Metabacillus sp. GX 13764]|uniref:prolipoprotein diacylglyceryl transferase n=1 Tax=Metabacillus kandeliae TaxID=2900151 RepID=UPI001E3B8CF5|nr:prolipoprotein diacylglyceryl transferase [Metabacillus kandeliae]